MPLDHTQARDLASRAVSTPLTTDEERDLAVHLVACRDCKTFYDGLGRLRSVLAGSVPSTPPEAALESAAHRARAVLLGDADPGPLARADDLRTAPHDAATTGPIPAPPDVGDDEPTLLDEDDELAALQRAITSQSPVRPSPEDTGPLAWSQTDRPDPDDVAPPAPPPIASTTVRVRPGGPAPRDPDATIGQELGPPLFTADLPEPPVEHPMAEPEGEDDAQPPRARTGGWVLAILATLIVAGIAGYLFVNRPRLLDSSRQDLPTAAQVRTNVADAFEGLDSLDATFDITRLGLYRFRQTDDRLVYSFSNAEITGRLLFEEPSRLREERTLLVADADPQRRTVVRSPDDLRVLVQEGDEPGLAVTQRQALGPAAAAFHPRLGLLEETVSVPARLLTQAADLEVVERVQFQERDAIRVRFGATPSELTRADAFDVLVDAGSWIPVRVRRSISRSDADVLGPSEVLRPDALDAAFGDRDRITTEIAELSDVVVGDVILPGEFTLDVPAGASPEPQDAGFDRVTIADLPGELPFDAHVPVAPPRGLREVAFAVSTETGEWGPDDAYPAPEGILQIMYTNGGQTFVIEERAFEDGAFDIEDTPLETGGLPVTTRSVVRAGVRYTYAVSPEVPPHVWAFVDDMLFVVTGHAPQNELVRLASQIVGSARTADGTPLPEDAQDGDGDEASSEDTSS